MSERATDEPTGLCGCSRPIAETIVSCTRCGHEVASTEFALSPRAARMADMIADLIVERLDETRRGHSGTKGRRTDLQDDQLAFEGEA